jgi:hypothetical protein
MTKKQRSIVVDTSTEMAEMPNTPTTAAGEVITHMAVAAFVRKFKDQMPGPIAFTDFGAHGKAIARLSRERGIEIKKVEDARFGEVNAYSIELMKTYFKVKDS